VSIVSFDSLSFSGLEWTLQLLPNEHTSNSEWYGRICPVNLKITFWVRRRNTHPPENHRKGNKGPTKSTLTSCELIQLQAI
jgi:hypothetical protein